MITLSLSDVVLRISAERNLDSTVATFKEIDIPVWCKLLEADPAEFFCLASYGYKMRQENKGRREIGREELDDFLRQFITKFYYVYCRHRGCIPSHMTEQLMFEIY